MPRIDILAELKSVIQTNLILNEAITDFISEMNDLKTFFKKTKNLESNLYLFYADKLFQKWTIHELLLFLVLFGQENLDIVFDKCELHPAILLENTFLFQEEG